MLQKRFRKINLKIPLLKDSLSNEPSQAFKMAQMIRDYKRVRAWLNALLIRRQSKEPVVRIQNFLRY